MSDFNGKLMLGWCRGESVSAPFETSIQHTLANDIVGFVRMEQMVKEAAQAQDFKKMKRALNRALDLASLSFIRNQIAAITSGPALDRARNLLMQMFVDADVEWFLMVDTDMVFGYEHVQKIMLAADPETRPVIGGLCFAIGEHGKINATMYDKGQNGSYVTYREYPRDVLMRVGFTGAAFLLIHRNVALAILDKFGPHWFSYTQEFGSAEDFAFCDRLTQLNIPLLVHTGVPIGHAKLRPITEEDFIADGGQVFDVSQGETRGQVQRSE